MTLPKKLSDLSPDFARWKDIVARYQNPSAFDPDEWNNALDATGYPQKTQLPPNFKQEPARPLTQKTTAAAAKQ